MNTIDYIMILLVALIAFISAKRGFIWSILNLGVMVASGVLSRLLAAPASELFYNVFFHDKIVNELYRILPAGSVSAQIGEGLDAILSELPLPVIAIAKQFGLYPDLAGSTQVLTVEAIEEDYIVPILTGVLSIIATVLLFIIIFAVLKIVARAIDRSLSDKEKHKFISRTNTLLGGIIGAIKGLIPVGIVCAVLGLIAPASGNDTLVSLVDGSFFCHLISSLFH